MPPVNLEKPADTVLLSRIAKRVIFPDTGCWHWTGASHKRTDHGMFGYTVQGKTTTLYVHRFVWEFFRGPVPAGLILDHVCRNPRCCNPDHLEPVTVGENNRRSPLHPSRKTHCKRNHEFTPENTYVFQGKYGLQRHCRTCNRERQRK